MIYHSYCVLKPSVDWIWLIKMPLKGGCLHPTEGRRLSWPICPVTYRYDLPAKQSPIQVGTGPIVEANALTTTLSLHLYFLIIEWNWIEITVLFQQQPSRGYSFRRRQMSLITTFCRRHSTSSDISTTLVIAPTIHSATATGFSRYTGTATQN